MIHLPDYHPPRNRPQLRIHDKDLGEFHASSLDDDERIPPFKTISHTISSDVSLKTKTLGKFRNYDEEIGESHAVEHPGNSWRKHMQSFPGHDQYADNYNKRPKVQNSQSCKLLLSHRFRNNVSTKNGEGEVAKKYEVPSSVFDTDKKRMPQTKPISYTISSDDTSDSTFYQKTTYMLALSNDAGRSMSALSAYISPQTQTLHQSSRARIFPSSPSTRSPSASTPSSSSGESNNAKKITRAPSNISEGSFEAASDRYVSYEEPLLMVYGLSPEFSNELKKHHGKLPNERKSFVSSLPLREITTEDKEDSDSEEVSTEDSELEEVPVAYAAPRGWSLSQNRTREF
jgi:hypothetical protein